MKMNLFRFLSFFLFVFIVGCEWESSDGDHSWTEELGWANFSGTYRNSSGDLISGSGFSSGEDEVSDTPDGPLLVVSGEAGGSYAARQATLSGRLAKYPQIVAGSVTLVFASGGITIGTFTDGGGGLSGTYALVPSAAPTRVGTGTIEYDTGRWTLNLEDIGFLVATDLSVDYTWVDTGAIVDDSDVDEDDDDISISSMHVTQTGNQLVFSDSEGMTYTGIMWKGSTPGGDDTGATSGEVTTGFEVSSDNVTITGTFSGNWASAGEDDAGSGNLTGKTIDGTWVRSGNALDMHGTSGD